MEFVVLGIEWVEGQPFLLVRDDDATEVRPEPVAGFDLSYRARTDLKRVCVGHRLGIGDPVCTRPVAEGSRTCRSCSIAGAMFASDLHHAHTKQPSGALTEHLKQSNLLYLAVFGDGSIKIGTSTEHRVKTRLTEQGARLARVVARTANGVRVRVLEDVVTDTLGIAQTVGIERKLSGLVQPRPTAELESIVDGQMELVHDALDGLAEWEPRQESWSNPAVWDGLFRYPNDLASGTHNLVASGAYGRVVRISRPESGADQFVADIKRIFGIRLERGTFEAPPVTAQHSLF